MKTSIKLFPCIFGIAAAAVSAAPLREGEFTRVVNDVRIVPGDSSPVPAKVGARISGSSAVATGAQSRAELRFSDNTLTRVGANSVFRMDLSSRTVEMDKGVILLQVPKQLGGAKVRTAAVTAAITGTTILMEFTPDGFVKIIVIEGEVDVSLNERRNQFRTLTSGDMWISRANDKTGLPMPVQVDLERLKKTSKLLNEKEFGPLGNQKQMTAALKDQGIKKQKGDLTNTSFQIDGRGRNVTLLVGNREHIPLATVQPPVEPPVDPPVKPPVVNVPVNVPGSTVFDDQATIGASFPAFAYNSSTGGYSALAGSAYVPGKDGLFGKYMFDDPQSFTELDEVLSQQDLWSVFKGDEVYISGGPAIESTTGPRNLIFGATNDLRFTEDYPVQDLNLVTSDQWMLSDTVGSLVFASYSGSIHFDDFNLLGTDQDVGFYADGPTSDININGLSSALITLPGGNFEASAGQDFNMPVATVEAKAIKVSSGRDIKLGGTTSGAAKLAASTSIRLKAQQSVKISNSSELRRLSQLDNPQVFIEAVNGSVDLDRSKVDADLVDMVSQRGDIRLTKAQVSAREIKGRVFDAGGTLLVSGATLGRGTNASDLIRLYGEGAEGVRFVGDTVLRGNVVDIAGTKVTIDRGSRVQLSNPGGTSIYADSHLYNNGTNGNFTGIGGGAQVSPGNQKPFSARPGY